MGIIAQRDVEELARHAPRSKDDAISIGALAKRLGVSFGTARRRLTAYAKANGFELEAGEARVGARGPRSTTWYLRRPNSLSLRQRGEGRGEGPPGPPRPPRPALPPNLPPALLTALTPDERPALAALLQVKTARTSELAQLLSTSPLRIDGMMSALRRKLRTHLRTRLVDEALSDGDTLYRLEESAR